MKTDSEIQKDVMDELNWEPILSAGEIGVAVKNQIVTLSGTVATYSKKSAAEDAAKRVSGVKAVALEIDVKPSSIGKRNDTEIAQAVINAIKWDARLPDENIKTEVENGWVTLEGNLEWEFQKTAAAEAVKNLFGVKGISNYIKIVSKIKPTEISEKIVKAFERSATLDAEKISVQTTGNKVTLTGTVRSLAEKMDAEGAAFSAPGITEVENNILVVSEFVLDNLDN